MIDKRYLFVVETATIMDNARLRALEPNKDGYYTVPLMVMGAKTLNGIHYRIDPIQRCITDPTSRFNIMLTDGKLYGEYDHPPVVDKKDIPRLLEIYQKCKSHHIRKVWSHPTPLSNGGILLMGEIKPDGPWGQYLEDNLRDPNMNTSFSIRSLCEEHRDVRTREIYRDVQILVTFDNIGAGGFKEACKRMSPANESLVVGPEDFIGSANDLKTAMESFTITDREFINLFGAKTIRIASQSMDVTGLYHPGSKSFIGDDGNKHSLVHQLLRG